MPFVAAVETALPEHVLAQEEVRALVERACEGRPELTGLLRVFGTAGVRRRHLAHPTEYYLSGRDFETRNRDFAARAVPLAARAARAALDRAGVEPRQVDHLYLATTTGLATPSVDAHLVEILGLRGDVTRSPLFGLGCAGGAAALARAAGHVRGAPGERALVVAVELCGQVFRPGALRPVDVVSAALFGDGAAAAVVAGDGCRGDGPRVTASRSVLFPGTPDVMGWEFTGDGMRLVLSREPPRIVEGPLREELGRFLGSQGLSPTDVARWVLHPGGRRVMESYARAFELDDDALAWTRASLAAVGNLSSASVLFVLADVMRGPRPGAGARGVVCALGPGFAAEMVLLTW